MGPFAHIQSHGQYMISFACNINTIPSSCSSHDDEYDDDNYDDDDGGVDN